MPASLKWRYQPPLLSGVKRPSLDLVEGIPVGVGRNYSDAARLGLIDSRIGALVRTMNVPGVMGTIACCEGHGGWGSFSSPYVAFRASVELAAILFEKLQAEALDAHRRLHFYWTVEGRFNDKRQLQYQLYVVGIDRYRWVSRRRLDHDIAIVTELARDAIAVYQEPGENAQ